MARFGGLANFASVQRTWTEIIRLVTRPTRTSGAPSATRPAAARVEDAEVQFGDEHVA